MMGFRLILAGLWLALAAYTTVVVAQHGLNLLPVFFGDIAKIGWPGQFNLDFLCVLTLSALWTAWRHSFSPLGVMLGLAAFFGGAGFLAPYLLFLSLRAKGDIKQVIIGARDAD